MFATSRGARRPAPREEWGGWWRVVCCNTWTKWYSLDTPRSTRRVGRRTKIVEAHWNEKLRDGHSTVLVVGGGLTAVQSAQYCLRKGESVILSSRRPLVERHVDKSKCWIDMRRASRHVSDFYHQAVDMRLMALRGARGGGSVPPLCMDDLRMWERRGKRTLVEDADPALVRTDGDCDRYP